MKKFINFVTKTVAGLALAAGISTVVAQAPTPAFYAGSVQYRTDGLLATNTAIIGSTNATVVNFGTNFANANYYYPVNPNTPEMGYGVFPVSPSAQWAFIQAPILQYSNQEQLVNFVLTNACAPVNFSNAVLNLIFQPIQDDIQLKYYQSGVPFSGFNLTNSSAFLVPMNISTNSWSVQTNGTEYDGCLATCQFALTNANGAKYLKLIGVSGAFTNVLVLPYGMRVSQWAPSK
jgi:hypothetical protein